MKAREYIKVRSLEEAYELNQKKNNVILGGMLWLKMQKNNKNALIDLSELGLDGIKEEDDCFKIGCMTSLRTLETNQRLADCFGSLFLDCTEHIVGVQFRNTATVGGSIFGRFGFSDIWTAMLALDAQVELFHGGIISLCEFAKMPYDNDILIRIIIKKDRRHAVYASQRRSGTDFPLIACCVAEDKKQLYVSVGARPARAELLTFPADTEKEEVLSAVKTRFSYGSNMRGGAEYRREIAAIHVGRLMDRLKASGIMAEEEKR